MQKVVNIVGKFFIVIFLGILVLGLVMWGIGDVIRGKGTSSIANVGNSEISSDEVDALMQQQKKRLAMSGMDIDLSGQMGELLKQNVMRQLVNTKLLENELRSLGIEFDAEDIIKESYTDKETGELNRETIQAEIQKHGSEELFLKEMLKEKKIEILESSLTSTIPLLDSYVKRIYNYSHQIRDITLVAFNKKLVSISKEPSDSDLRNFYEENKDKYFTPEYRSVSYILINKESLNDKLFDGSKPDEDVVYEAANDLLDKLAEGASLKESAEELQFKLVNIPEVNNSGKDKSGKEVKFPEINNFYQTIFATDESEISDLLESQDSKNYAVLQVNSVTPKRARALDEVRGLLIEDWKEKKMEEKLFSGVKKIREDIISGKMEIDSLKGRAGVKISKEKGLKRNSDKLPAEFLGFVFDAPVGKISETYFSDGKIYLAKIDAAKNPKEIDEFELLDTKSIIQDQISQEIMVQYLNYLGSKYSINVNK